MSLILCMYVSACISLHSGVIAEPFLCVLSKTPSPRCSCMWIAGTPGRDQIRSWAMWLKPHYLGSITYSFFSFGMLGLEILAPVAREGNWRGRVNIE